jgi:four helix bundle protein
MNNQESIHFYESHKDFTSLICWNRAREVKLYFYQNVLTAIPNSEKYNLDIQIRKASISITANIAEGHGRYHLQEAVQFYRISRGSLSELKDHLITCKDLGYVSEKICNLGVQKIEKAKISLNGFINYNNKKIKSLKKPQSR